MGLYTYTEIERENEMLKTENRQLRNEIEKGIISGRFYIQDETIYRLRRMLHEKRENKSDA